MAAGSAESARVGPSKQDGTGGEQGLSTRMTTLWDKAFAALLASFSSTADFSCTASVLGGRTCCQWSCSVAYQKKDLSWTHFGQELWYYTYHLGHILCNNRVEWVANTKSVRA